MSTKRTASKHKPSDVLYDAADVLRRYVKIGYYRSGPAIGHSLHYLGEIKEAIRWLEYAATRADQVLQEPTESEKRAVALMSRYARDDARTKRRRRR